MTRYLTLALLLFACGGREPASLPVAPASAGTPPDAAPPVGPVGPIAYFVQDLDWFELVFCCDGGRCDADSCATGVEGSEAKLQDGRVARLANGDSIACRDTPTRTRRTFRPSEPGVVGKPAIWPVARADGAMWFPADFEPRPVTLSARDRAQIVGDDTSDSAIWRVKAVSVDLDRDGRLETLLGVDGAHTGGLYLRTVVDGASSIRKIHGDDFPYIYGLVDVTGDGWRDVLHVDNAKEPPVLFVVDARNGVELLRTPWFCEARPERH